ncbi:MAG: PAS domain S-box protein [Candidatus Deferrimicrobiaceae bacterium]
MIQEEVILEETRGILATLAKIPAVGKGEEDCSTLLSGLLKNYPRYINFAAARPDGEVVCSAVPFHRPVSVADRPYFRSALENRLFSVGQYQGDRITGKSSINFGYPVSGRNAEVTGVVFAALDLSHLTKLEFAVDAQTPENSTYVKLDSDGTVLSAYPETQLFGVGNPLEKSLFERITKEKNGSFEGKGTDGVERLYLFSALNSSLFKDRVYVLLGIPKKGLFAECDRVLVRNLAVVAGMVLLALMATWFGGSILIVRPVGSLVKASKRLASGDLTARTGLRTTQGELGLLGMAFDNLAEELQRGQDVSRRMQEIATEKQELGTRLLSLINNIPGVVYRGLKDWSVSFIGAEVVNLTGYAPEEFTGGALLWKNLIHPDDLEGVKETFRQAVKEKSGVLRAEYRIRHKEGGIRWIADRRQLIYGESGAFAYVDGLLLDITVVKKHELELEENKDRYRDLVEHSQALIGTHDLSGRILSVNPWAANVLGYSQDELLRMNLRDLLVPEVQHEFGIYLDKIREHGTAQGLLLLQTRKGEQRIWEYNNTLRTEGVPEPIVRGMAQDITERMRADKALMRLNMAVEQVSEAVVITDTEGRIEYVNFAFERITGYSREEAVGRNMRFLKSGKQDETFYKTMWETITRGESWTGHFTNRKKDGTLYEEQAAISPIRNTSGKIIHFVAVKRDMTRERELQRQLQTAQRMEAVGTLAGGIAHDFNNALTGVFGFGEMLRSQLAGNEDALSNLDEILRCGERAATLTRQILTYSRRQIIEPINLSLNTVITDLLKLVSKVLGEQIEIRTFLEKDLPIIRADIGQIEQVVMNLVMNARDAMPGGGQLRIETEVANLDAEFVRHHPYMSVGSYVVLMVSDTGVGMDQKTQERVFEPFFTTKAPDKGTGLGLAMVYGIVKQHKGFIHLYSEPGKGTTIKIYLPPVEGAPDVLESQKPSEIRGGTETILLAEDDESVRMLVERSLRDLGYTLLVTRNGEEAIEIFHQNSDKISLALLDVVMPLKGGKEAYEVIHRIKPELKVIFMSGYTADSVHESFVKIAGVPFLPKPFSPSSLARKVREVLGR